MAQYMTQQGYVTSSLQKAKTRARQEAEDYGRSYVENTESGKTVYRTNPRQPHKRVRKALKKYVKRQTKNPVGLPAQYTPAKVRVTYVVSVCGFLTRENAAHLFGAVVNADREREYRLEAC